MAAIFSLSPESYAASSTLTPLDETEISLKFTLV